MNRKRTRAIIKSVILALIVIGIPLLIYLKYRDTLFNDDWLTNLPLMLEQYKGMPAALILTGIQILQVIICLIPGQPIQFAASYMFGIIRGYLISIIGAVIGAAIAFYLAKILGRDMLYFIFDEDKMDEVHRRINSGKGLLGVLIIYLIPGFPKDMVAYVAGISDMRIRPFLLVSTIGRTPGMVGSLLLGHFFSKNNYIAILILALLTVLILIICYVYRNRLISILDDIEAKDELREEKKLGKETENR